MSPAGMCASWLAAIALGVTAWWVAICWLLEVAT